MYYSNEQNTSQSKKRKGEKNENGLKFVEKNEPKQLGPSTRNAAVHL